MFIRTLEKPVDTLSGVKEDNWIYSFEKMIR
jgi:hypothetical protein